MASYARARLSDAVTRGLYYSGAFAASRQLLRKTSAVILRYHSVCEHAALAPVVHRSGAVGSPRSVRSPDEVPARALRARLSRGRRGGGRRRAPAPEPRRRGDLRRRLPGQSPVRLPGPPEVRHRGRLLHHGGMREHGRAALDVAAAVLLHGHAPALARAVTASSPSNWISPHPPHATRPLRTPSPRSRARERCAGARSSATSRPSWR